MTNIPRVQKQPLLHIPKRANKTSQGNRRNLLVQLKKNAITVEGLVILSMIVSLKEGERKQKLCGRRKGKKARSSDSSGGK